MPREPNASELNWMRSAMMPIHSFELDSDDKDLERINEMAATVTVIALGEVTHGSDEIYRLKNRIVKSLVEKEGFDVFALEANMPEAYKLNDYIINGKGNPKKLLAGMHFWIWNTHEMLDLIEWMKEYNSYHAKKVSFTGIDMQFFQGPLAEVSSICRKYNDATIIPSLKLLEDTLKEFGTRMKSNQALSIKAEEFLKQEWISLRCFAAKDISDKKQQEWFLQNVRLLEQCTADVRQSRRNEFMAENLLWIKSHNRDSKIIVWAHNAHVQRTGDDMGSYLSKDLKTNYATVGFAFQEGHFTANGKKGVTTYAAQRGTPASYEYYLHKSGEPAFLLDLRHIPETGGSKWLYKSLDLRRTGAAPMYDEFEPFDLVSNFDMLLFIDKSTNSRLLHKHGKIKRRIVQIF